MKILAVDTATPTCSVAVIKGARLLAEAICDNGRTHSEHLMRMIDTVLGLAGIPVNRLDGFAVTHGPGSFTGLRIGVGTVQGLAAAAVKPVVGISSLEALATQDAGLHNLVCPMIDARRGEVYYAQYRTKEGKLQAASGETVASPVRAVQGIAEPTLFIGNGALHYRKQLEKEMGSLAHFASQDRHTLRASSVAILGAEKLVHGDFRDIRQTELNYLRKSDAEINLSKKKTAG